MPKGRTLPSVKPDLDNYVKSVTDAGNGVLWKDDGQICWILAEKIYGQPPGIELIVGKVEEMLSILKEWDGNRYFGL